MAQASEKRRRRTWLTLAALSVVAVLCALVATRVLFPHCIPMGDDFDWQGMEWDAGPLVDGACAPDGALTNIADGGQAADAPGPEGAAPDADSDHDGVVHKTRGQSKRAKGPITKTGPGRYRVSRQWVDNLLQGKAKTGGATAVPVFRDGSIAGFRLKSVGGTVRKLGLQSGDIVVAVNGRKIDSAERAIGAYGSLAKAKRVSLKVLRGGGPRGFTYLIE